MSDALQTFKLQYEDVPQKRSWIRVLGNRFRRKRRNNGTSVKRLRLSKSTRKVKKSQGKS